MIQLPKKIRQKWSIDVAVASYDGTVGANIPNGRIGMILLRRPVRTRGAEHVFQCRLTAKRAHPTIFQGDLLAAVRCALFRKEGM